MQILVWEMRYLSLRQHFRIQRGRELTTPGTLHSKANSSL